MRVVLVVLLCLVVALSGCSGSEEAAKTSSGTPSETSAAQGEESAADPVRKVRIGTIAGRVPPPKRRRAARQVVRLVDHWVERAYAGPQPRGTAAYRKAFARFTPGATRRAWTRRGITSNARLGGGEREVRLVRRVLALDLLGNARGRPAAGTARVRVVLTDPRTERRHLVTGRLLLSNGARGWRVFGFDVARRRA